MPCRSLASFLSHVRYCSVIFLILFDLTCHMPSGLSNSCCVFNLPRRYDFGLGYLANNFGNTILTCLRYVRFKHMTATMCFHCLCGPLICCWTIKSSCIGLIIQQLYFDISILSTRPRTAGDIYHVCRRWRNHAECTMEK